MNKLLVSEKVFHPSKITVIDKVEKLQKMASDEKTLLPLNLE